MDATNAFSHARDRRRRARRPQCDHRRAGARARRCRQASPAGCSGLDQPTYVAVVTDARSPSLRRSVLPRVEHARLRPGPESAKFDNTPGDGRPAAPAPRSRAAARLPELRGLRAGAAHGAAASTRCCTFLRDLARAARPAAERELAELDEFAGRKLDAWDITYYSERLQEAALQHLAGRAAAVLPAAARARRPVRASSNVCSRCSFRAARAT